MGSDDEYGEHLIVYFIGGDGHGEYFIVYFIGVVDDHAEHLKLYLIGADDDHELIAQPEGENVTMLLAPFVHLL